MVKVDLKGIATVRSKGRVYYYAWRGGPRLEGEPGSPEFMRGYHDAIADRRTPDKSRFHSLVTEYRASTAYTSLSPSTKKRWAYTLDRIAEHFGELRIAQFDRPEKTRPVIRQWRSQLAAQPSTAGRSTTILTNSTGRPWKVAGFGGSFNRAKIVAGMGDVNLHFHDLRGTAATRFYTAGLELRFIAEILGWEEETVATIIRRYVGRTAATKAPAAERAENISCKTGCKTVRENMGQVTAPTAKPEDRRRPAWNRRRDVLNTHSVRRRRGALAPMLREGPVWC